MSFNSHLFLRNKRNIKWKDMYWNSAVYTNVMHTPSIYNRRSVRGWRKELIPNKRDSTTFVGGRSKHHLGSYNMNSKSILSTVNDKRNICDTFNNMHITTDSIINKYVPVCCKKNKISTQQKVKNIENYNFTTQEYLHKKHKSYQQNLPGESYYVECGDSSNPKVEKISAIYKPPYNNGVVDINSNLQVGKIGASSSSARISNLKYKQPCLIFLI